MRTAIRWLAIAALVILVVMTGTVWAQEEEEARTPQQVVSDFSYALAGALRTSRIDPALLNEVVTAESQEALNKWGDRLIGPLGMYLIRLTGTQLLLLHCPRPGRWR